MLWHIVTRTSAAMVLTVEDRQALVFCNSNDLSYFIDEWLQMNMYRIVEKRQHANGSRNAMSGWYIPRHLCSTHLGMDTVLRRDGIYLRPISKGNSVTHHPPNPDFPNIPCYFVIIETSWVILVILLLYCFGLSVRTCVLRQNPQEVHGITEPVIASAWICHVTCVCFKNCAICGKVCEAHSRTRFIEITFVQLDESLTYT